MRHFPLRELGYAVAFLVVLLAIYVGMYASMVQRTIGLRHEFDERFSILPRYETELSWVCRAFEPVHEFDRRIRQPYWTDVEFLDLELEKRLKFFERVDRDHRAASKAFVEKD